MPRNWPSWIFDCHKKIYIVKDYPRNNPANIVLIKLNIFPIRSYAEMKVYFPDVWTKFDTFYFQVFSSKRDNQLIRENFLMLNLSCDGIHFGIQIDTKCENLQESIQWLYIHLQFGFKLISLTYTSCIKVLNILVLWKQLVHICSLMTQRWNIYKGKWSISHKIIMLISNL